MMHSVALFLRLSLLLGLLCGVGCTGSLDRPATAPVRGRVTYKGKPVANASVCFLCPGAPRLATGLTDAEGNYQLTTYETNDGAVIGTHTVTVNKLPDALPEIPAADVVQDRAAMTNSIEQAMQQTAQKIEKAERARPLLPEKYSDRNSSDLKKEVVVGENDIDLDLRD